MPGERRNSFLLLYGSQTGQAKAIAEEIAEKAETQHRLKANIHCLSQTEKKFNIEREKCVVIVTSTTGDGEPPDTVAKFFRRLNKKTLQDDYLSHINYALLGLGDSNYTNFCKCGKAIDRRFEELGAKRFYDSGFADDAVGLEVMVEPWMDGLFPALHRFLGLSNDMEASELCNDDKILNGHVNSDNPSDNNRNANALNSIQSKQENSQMDQFSGLANGDHIHSGETSKIKKSNSELVTNGDGHSEDIKDLSSVSSSGEVQIQEESLRTSTPPLSESSLTLPAMPQAYLHIEYLPEESLDVDSLPMQNGLAFPSSATAVSMATVLSAQRLTRKDAVRKTLSLRLDVKNSDIKYLPGDSVSIVCTNCDNEVDQLLNRLDVLPLADQVCMLDILPDTKKRNPSVPSHIPQKCTLRHVFISCVDIRDAPKKALLRCLVEYTNNQSEKRRLQELCSKQGTEHYSKFIRESGISLLDLLTTFPSCNPPVQRILEHLPRLQPRPYSVCSSPVDEPGMIEVAFNIVNIDEGCGRTYSRLGVCTGMLDSMTKSIQQSYGVSDSVSSLTSELSTLSLDQNQIKIPVFGRTGQNFHMPENLSTPIIMIGPGTGVAPFIGFLRHRKCLKHNMAETDNYGGTWLFYGCRHKERDYIYRNELEDFENSGILTKLCVSFSRDEQQEDSPRYVQDNLLLHSAEIISLLDSDAMIFVCGDAKNMAKDVNEAFLQILQKEKGHSQEEAKRYLMKMRLYKKYMEDVWT